jgi:Pyridoxamine 5'-phosphate oxidase
VDLDEARSFLRENHRAVLATRRKDGSPQLTPVLVGLDGEGRATVSTRETAIKT